MVDTNNITTNQENITTKVTELKLSLIACYRILLSRTVMATASWKLTGIVPVV